MNKLIIGLVGAAVLAGNVSGVAFANTGSGNFGSIVKVKDCASMGDVASRNFGSIVTIDGGGACDINEVMKSPAVTDNFGSIVKITNVCGDTSGVGNGNFGSIIKVESNGPCKEDEPTTVVITPEEPTEETPPVVVTPVEEEPEAETPVETPETPAEEPNEDKTPKSETPKELPSTGPASIAAGLLGASSLGYGAYAYAQSRRNLSGLGK